jgi:NADH dehydrogenase FAD-containing subunit
MGRKLVLIGGGHAHMVTLANIHVLRDKGHEVTVIGPSPRHYYSGMGPGMLGATYTPKEISFATRKVVRQQGGTFIQDKAVRIDPEKKIVHLMSGDEVPYDVLSCNAGSMVPLPEMKGESRNVFPVKPIEELQDAQAALLDLSWKRPGKVVVVGGGPAALEIAGNVEGLISRKGTHPLEITVLAGKRFLSHAAQGVRKRAVKSFENRGIRINEAGYVQSVDGQKVILESGAEFEGDVIFLALGVRPSPIFADSGLPTGRDGGLLVNSHLQSVEHPEIFGGGDCISFQDRALDKVGVYAVRENPVLFHNIKASLDGEPLKGFDPGGAYLLIYNLGDGTGIFHKGPILFGGKLAFKVKDWIDRKFMVEFQKYE